MLTWIAIFLDDLFVPAFLDIKEKIFKRFKIGPEGEALFNMLINCCHRYNLWLFLLLFKMFLFAFKNMLIKAFKAQELTAEHAHMDLFTDALTSIAFIIFHIYTISIM